MEALARQLQFVESSHVGWLQDFAGLTFSPDGRHAYTVSQDGSVVGVAESADGLELVYLQTLDPAVSHTPSTREIWFADEGEVLYVQRGLRASFGATGGLAELWIYRRSTESGALQPLAHHPEVGDLLAHPADGLHVYEILEGRLRTYLRDAAGRLALADDVELGELTGGAVEGEAAHLESSPDGLNLYLVNDDGGTLAVFARSQATGGLELVQVLRRGDGFGSAETLDRPVFLFGGEVMAALSHREQVADAFLVFTRDGSGRLTLAQASEFLPEPFARNLRHLTPSGDGEKLLAAWKTFDAYAGVASFTFDPAWMPVQADSIAIEEELHGLSFTPGGERLLLIHPEELRAYAWDTDSGEIGAEESIEIRDDGFLLNSPEGMVLHPSGEFLYISSSRSDALGIFRRSPGGLEFSTAHESVETPFRSAALAVAPDGRHLYSSFANDNTLSAFELDPMTGRPVHLETLTDPADEMGLGSPRQLEFTPDGALLLVGSRNALASFARDAETGLLEFRHVDDRWGQFDHDSLVVSPDGRHVYTAENFSEGAVNALRLDPDEGSLASIQKILDGENGVEGLRNASSLDMTPDGRWLVVGTLEGMVVFERDTTSGLLEFNRFRSAEQPISLRIGNDGVRVFTTHFRNRIEMYLLDPQTGRLDRFEQLDNEIPGVTGLGPLLAFDPQRPRLYSAGERNQVASLEIGRGQPCELARDRLCLGDERFEVKVDWRDFDGHTGTAFVAPSRTDDSGILWFFGEDNWEMQVKVLDACSFNGRYWVFAASATTVETTLTVTDRLTGDVREYFNPLGRAAPAVTDTDAFASCDATGGSAGPGSGASLAQQSDQHRVFDEAEAIVGTSAMVEPFTCLETPTSRCLSPRMSTQPNQLPLYRFLVEVEWRDATGASGEGFAAPARTADSAMFWFFGPDNWEMMVKVLDACTFNGHFWVLSAATTDVEYTLRVTDSQTGEVREYENPLGQAASALADVEAFAGCP